MRKKNAERRRINALPFFLFVVLLCNFISSPVVAQVKIKQADMWYRLNHYDQNGVSDIANSEYFLAKDGRINPEAEYVAFVDILKKYIADGSNSETLCQFPARVTFAINSLDWFKKRPHCEAYEEEVHPTKIESISLIFASGYFDNPSSYYGHTLLKFNYDNSVLNQRTLNSSLNYGADSGTKDGPIMYILNGVFGGYQASYQRNNNFINSHRYTNAQLRDIWEYKLNLTPEQVRFIAEHSWELKRAKFTYYFFNDNCAHRIADLVERATSSRLAYSHGFWALPMQVLEHAKVIDNNGGSLISSEVYQPSLKSSFSRRYEGLKPDEKESFLSFFRASNVEKSKLVHNLNEKILLMILEHLDIKLAKLTIKKSKNDEDKALQEQRRIVLVQLLQRPSGYKQSSLNWGSNNTLLNYKPISVLRSGVLRRENKNYLSFNYQMSNNDLLDNPIFGQERSKVVMGSIQADISNESIQVRDVTLIDIMNLNTNPLPMWLTNEYSWQLRLAYDHRNSICKSCGSFGLTGKYGKSLRFNDEWMAYTLAGMTLRHKEADGFGFASLVSDSAVIYSANPSHALKAGLNLMYDPFKGKSEAVLNTEYSYKFSPDKDIRFSYERNGENENFISIRLGYYFN